MDENERRLLRREGLAFFGRITAGQSHEVTNVLNIINELAGLQGDLIAVSDRGESLNIKKLKEVNEKIRNQVQRGETIVRSINRFAHSADGPEAVFDLREALEQVVYLAQRPARLAKTVLDQAFCSESISLETSPFGFKQAVFTCVEIALAASAGERHVTVGSRIVDGGAEIVVTSADPILPDPSTTDRRVYLDVLMRELEGKVAFGPVAENAHRITLFFGVRHTA